MPLSPERHVQQILDANLLQYRSRVNEAREDAGAVMGVLMERFNQPPQEVVVNGEIEILEPISIRDRDTILCTMGWMAEHLSQQEELSETDEENLERALNLVIDQIRNDGYLSLYMTACWSVLHFGQPQAIPPLAELATDVYTAIETHAAEGDESLPYMPRGYVFENDLLERLVEKLEGNENQEVQNLMETLASSAVSEAHLRPRIRYAAQRGKRE